MTSPRISTIVLVLAAMSAPAQEFITERFQYPEDSLGPPWEISNSSDGSTATTGNASTFGGYKPDGGQATFHRPSSSSGILSAISATLESGSNAGTMAWTVSQGSRVRHACHFSFSNISNTNGFAFRLMQGTNRIASFRIFGLPAYNTATLQYASNGANAFESVPGTPPTLVSNHWYLLEATVRLGTLAAGGEVTLDIALYDMSDGGSLIYSAAGISAHHFEALQDGAAADFQTGVTSGIVTYRLAKVSLADPSDPCIPSPFIKETFPYSVGPVGLPWTVNNASGGSNVSISDSAEWGGYKPDGKQLTFFRPGTSAGAVSAALPTGANPGTAGWSVWDGDSVKLICHFFYTNISNGNAFVIRLWQGSAKIATFRVLGKPAINTAVLEYDSTGSYTFEPLPGVPPTLQPNRWYRLEATVTVEDLRAGYPVILDISLFDMSNGGLDAYTVAGLEAAHATAISPFQTNTSFQTGIISGIPNYSVAKVDLLPVLPDNPTASSGAELLVTEFGAVPDDDLDDGPAIRAALDAARAFHYPIIGFPAGRYDFSEVSDPAAGILEISDFDDISFIGEEAELMGRGLKPLFRIKRCGNLWVQGLRVDWDPLPFTAGVVVGSDTGFCDIEVAPDHPLLEKPIESINTLDPISKAFIKTVNSKYFVLSQRRADPPPPAAEIIGDPANRILRIHRVSDPEIFQTGSHHGSMPAVGSHIVAYYHVRGAFAFQAIACGNVVFEDVRVYSVPGGGLMINNCQGVVRIENCAVMRKPGTLRWKTTSVDAFFPNMNRGRVELIDCLFEDMGDDGCNVHGTYSMVHDRTAANEIVLRGWTSPFTEGSPTLDDLNPPNSQFLPGDIIEFSEEGRRHAPGFEAQVAEVLPDVLVETSDGRTVRLKKMRLDQNLPEYVESAAIVANASEVAMFLMKNCTVRRNRGQGVRVQTRDALIEDCVFDDIQGNAIVISCDADVAHESIAARNVTIRYTTFREAIRAVTSTVGRNPPIDPEVHENLTIENCLIEKCGATPFKIHSMKGSLIRQNTFFINGTVPVEVMHSSDVQIENNQILPPP